MEPSSSSVSLFPANSPIGVKKYSLLTQPCFLQTSGLIFVCNFCMILLVIQQPSVCVLLTKLGYRVSCCQCHECNLLSGIGLKWTLHHILSHHYTYFMTHICSETFQSTKVSCSCKFDWQFEVNISWFAFPARWFLMSKDICCSVRSKGLLLHLSVLHFGIKLP